MALEFICADAIAEGKKIALPRESSNGKTLKYKIDKEKREIVFFYADSRYDGVFELNTWTAPKGARKMEFTIYKKHGQNILEVPIFYGSKGEILKEGNR